MGPVKKPDIEFRRKVAPGTYRSYGHIYWRPFIVYLFGRTIIGKFGRTMIGKKYLK